MTRPTKANGLVAQLTEPLIQVFRYTFETGLRIFGPSKDDYPEIGVQPFEGDPTDDKNP